MSGDCMPFLVLLFEKASLSKPCQGFEGCPVALLRPGPRNRAFSHRSFVEAAVILRDMAVAYVEKGARTFQSKLDGTFERMLAWVVIVNV